MQVHTRDRCFDPKEIYEKEPNLEVTWPTDLRRHRLMLLQTRRQEETDSVESKSQEESEQLVRKLYLDQRRASLDLV